MLILNYAHPLTAPQQAQIAALLGVAQLPPVRDLPNQIDRQRPLAEVATELADAAGLDATEWQTIPLLLNPPALAPVASALLAELHGRCGYFVPIIHIRPIAGSLPPTFEAAEIVNLQSLREAARTRRGTA